MCMLKAFFQNKTSQISTKNAISVQRLESSQMSVFQSKGRNMFSFSYSNFVAVTKTLSDQNHISTKSESIFQNAESI